MTTSNSEHGISRTVCARIPSELGEFQLCHYENTYDHKDHLALVCGEVHGRHDVLVRVHSECFTGDVLGSRRCDCGPQLARAMASIAETGHGVIVYLRQEGRGIGLEQKLRAYNLQDEGYDTVDANLLLGHQADERDYWAAAGILADLGVRSINLLTNNPAKIEHLRALGVDVTRRTPLVAGVTADNRAYLSAKVQRMRHMLDLQDAAQEPVMPASLQSRLHDLRSHLETVAPPRNRPHVTVTYAQSLNGVIAGPNGEPLRLSSEDAMRVTHTLRAMHDAILVGVGTILADDPRLTTRLVEGPSPRPVILDTHLRTPHSARILDHPTPPLIACSMPAFARVAQLQSRGAEILELPSDPAGRVRVDSLLQRLVERGVRSLMVEGGARVIGEFLRLGMADRVIVTVAPRFEVGPGAIDLSSGVSEGAGATGLATLAGTEWHVAGGDLIAWGEVAASDVAAGVHHDSA